MVDRRSRQEHDVAFLSFQSSGQSSSNSTGKRDDIGRSRPMFAYGTALEVKLLGDLEIICGSRDGEGRWLALDGSAYIPAACMPLQHPCGTWTWAV